ncbi:hypothetical protein V5O48_017898, partial [Marasmius crinis-equi]
GSLFSPYVVETDVAFDALLQSAVERQDNCELDPFDSPLSTPASSRSTTPEPNSLPEAPGALSAELIDKKLATAAKSPPTQCKRKHTDEQEGSTELRKRKKKKGRNRSAEEVAKSKQRGKDHKRRKRQEQLGDMLCQDPDTLLSVAEEQKRHLDHALEKTNKTKAPMSDLQNGTASTGYIGNHQYKGDPNSILPQQRKYGLDELYKDGKHNFQLIRKSDHMQYVPCPTSDKLHVVMVPGPKDKKWEGKMKEAASLVKEVGPECSFRDEKGRQGAVNSINYGVSMGNEQPRPMVLNDQGRKRKRAMEKILAHKSFISIAGFMSTTFLTYAPLLFFFYAEITSAMLERYPDLSLPVYNSIFAACTLNFGPQTVCLPHRDSKNLAFGWCAITALGNYGYTKGGHIVLWDLKLIFKFPPGYTIFIPSAVVCHLNTKLQPGEERYSFTMYTSGDIFRWVEHGFQTETNYRKTPQAKADAHLNATRWKRGMNMFSTMAELKSGLR